MTQTTDTPVVSVVIPAFNAAWCIERAIESVLAQTFRSFELIVVDDGSTDNTRGILDRYVSSLTVVSQPNGGMSSARNAGIRSARGRYLAFLDADDRWYPTKLERQVALLEQRPELAFCAARAVLEDPQGLKVGEWAGNPAIQATVSDVFAHHAAVAGGASAVLAHRELVVDLAGFDETLAGAEDTDLWIRLAARGGFACLDEPLVVVIRRPGSVSRNREAMRHGALAMTIKNRQLLPADKQGAFWRSIYASVLCDYAKWSYRDGHRIAAIRDLLNALYISPIKRGRLALSLILAIATGQHF